MVATAATERSEGRREVAKLGTQKHPAVVRVRSQERAVALLKLCEERGWVLLAGIEPDKPEDVTDVERLLGARLDLGRIPGNEERLCLFHRAFPDIAVKETRSAYVMDESEWGLPPDVYTFIEHYCVDPHCDCRYALVWVMRDEGPECVATIVHRFDGRPAKQTTLDPQAPQSPLADAALKLFRTVLAAPAYEARLERHYRMFKEAVADPDHPINRLLVEEGLQMAVPIVQERIPLAPDGTIDLGLKKTCPCGSGKRYKRCCWLRQGKPTATPGAAVQ